MKVLRCIILVLLFIFFLPMIIHFGGKSGLTTENLLAVAHVIFTAAAIIFVLLTVLAAVAICIFLYIILKEDEDEDAVNRYLPNNGCDARRAEAMRYSPFNPVFPMFFLDKQ